MDENEFPLWNSSATQPTTPGEHCAVNTEYQSLIEPQLGRGKGFFILLVLHDREVLVRGFSWPGVFLQEQVDVRGGFSPSCCSFI